MNVAASGRSGLTGADGKPEPAVWCPLMALYTDKKSAVGADVVDPDVGPWPCRQIGAICEGTSNIQLSTIAKLISTQYKQ